MTDRDILKEMGTLHRAAGELATDWALLEDIVEAIVWAIAGLPPDLGRALTKNINFVNQMKTIPLMLKAKYPERFDKDAWNTLHNDIKDCRIKRNSIVHGNWEAIAGTPDNPVLVGLEYESRNSIVPKPVGFSRDQIKEVSKKIGEIHMKLLIHLHETYGLLPSPNRLSKLNP